MNESMLARGGEDSHTVKNLNIFTQKMKKSKIIRSFSVFGLKSQSTNERVQLKQGEIFAKLLMECKAGK